MTVKTNNKYSSIQKYGLFRKKGSKIPFNFLFLHPLKYNIKMGNFLKSFFSSKKENTDTGKIIYSKKNFDTLKYDGLRAQKIGQMDFAIRCYIEALNMESDFETMNYLVGAYTLTGKLQEARVIIDQMIEIEPNHPEIFITRANICYMLEQYTQVLADCNTAIELNTENHPAYFLMAKAKKASGDALGAIVDLTKTISLKDDFMEAHLLRAEVLHSIHQEKEALEDVEKAITLSPEEENAYLLRGEIKEKTGDKENALANYQQVIDLNPFNEKAYLQIGQLYISQEMYDEAISFFDDAIEIKNDFAKAYSERGRAKYLKGDKKASAEDMKKALELNPDGEEAQKLEGQLTNFNDMYKGGIY